MDRLEETINENYYWRAEYRLALNWAEMALNDGASLIEVIPFVVGRLFQKPEVKV